MNSLVVSWRHFTFVYQQPAVEVTTVLQSASATRSMRGAISCKIMGIELRAHNAVGTPTALNYLDSCRCEPRVLAPISSS